MTIATELESKQRQALLQEMPPALQVVAQQLEAIDKKVARGTLVNWHQEGVLVNQALGDKTTYGENAVDKLAEFLDRLPPDLYAARDTARTYNRQEIEQLAARVTVKGGYMSISHLRCMQTQPAELRRELTEKFFSEGLSVRALADLVTHKSRSASKRQSKAGRKPKTPTCPQTAAKEICRGFASTVKRADGWTAALDIVLQLAPEQCDNYLRECLADSQAQTIKIAAVVQKLEKFFERAIAHVDRALACKAKNMPAQNKPATDAAPGSAAKPPAGHPRRSMAA